MDDQKVFDPELKRLAVVVVLGSIMTILDATIVNVAINTLGRDFHAPLSTIQWVLTGYTLALAMTIPLTGWAIKRFGARRMWIISIVLFISGSVLCGAAWSVTSLVIFRILQAVGGGLLMPIGQTMLANKAGPQRMGRVMSVVAVPAMLGPALGPVIGGLIVGHLSWRWMFYINVPFCAAALIAAFAWLPRDTDRDTTVRLDGLGLLLLSPGLAALVYGLSQTGSGHGVTSPQVYGWVAVGLALVAAFAVHALRRGDRALVNLSLFRDRGFTASVVMMFVYVGAVFGVMFISPVYFQTVRGDSALIAGLLLAPLGVGAALAMPLAGRLTDRVGSRQVGVAGLLLVLAGLTVYTQLDATTSKVLLAAAIFVVGIGHGTLMPSMMASVYQTLPRRAVPEATTASNIVIRVGSSFGVAAIAVALQTSIRHELPGTDGTVATAAKVKAPDILSKLSTAFGHTFWWTVAIAAIALIPALLIPRRPTTPTPTPDPQEAMPTPS